MFDQNLSGQEEVILDFQESSLLQENSCAENKISLQVLSKMTGFSEELIHQELFAQTNEASEKEVSLETLRAAMLKLIDSTFASEET